MSNMGILSTIVTELIAFHRHKQIPCEVLWVHLNEQAKAVLTTTTPMGSKGKYSQTIYIDLADLLDGRLPSAKGLTEEEEEKIDDFLFEAKDLKRKDVIRIDYVFLVHSWLLEINKNNVWITQLELNPRIGLKYVKSTADIGLLTKPLFHKAADRQHVVYLLPEQQPPFSQVPLPNVQPTHRLDLSSGGEVYVKIGASEYQEKIRGTVDAVFTQLQGVTRTLKWRTDEIEPSVICLGHEMPLFMESHTIAKLVHLSAWLGYLSHEATGSEVINLPIFLESLDSVRRYAACKVLSEFTSSVNLTVCIRYSTNDVQSLMNFFLKENKNFNPYQS
ncbi:hypothetical protein [Comamonas thiooxydans]|uniref:hypothetical protein n=1 Tax=Comamonas thiooxydans TaxID=363952 RepID=UPI000B418DF3|nr:hypothetical protein [Comamonas thiooxydans]